MLLRSLPAIVLLTLPPENASTVDCRWNKSCMAREPPFKTLEIMGKTTVLNSRPLRFL